MDTDTKTETRCFKNCKKVVHKAAEATDRFMGNKIADKIMKPKLTADENSRNAEEIIISLEKRNIE